MGACMSSTPKKPKKKEQIFGSPIRQQQTETSFQKGAKEEPHSPVKEKEKEPSEIPPIKEEKEPSLKEIKADVVLNSPKSTQRNVPTTSPPKREESSEFGSATIIANDSKSFDKLLDDSTSSIEAIFDFDDEQERYEPYYLNEFHMKPKECYSSEKDFNSLLSSSIANDKPLLASKILKLNERQWNKENIMLSNLMKINRENLLDSSLHNKYLRNTILLHNHFNWVVFSLAYYYNYSLYAKQSNWFSVEETFLPHVDSTEWINGFEWKGIYIKVLPYVESKKFRKEIKALRYAFFEYLQLIDCVKLSSKKSNNLSNELIFPLSSYAVFNGMVLTATVCVNKYCYEDIKTCENNQVFFSGKDSFDASSIFNPNEKKNDVANEDFNLSSYCLDDLKESKILGNITKNNLVKVIDELEEKSEKYKLMLINASELLPGFSEDSKSKRHFMKIDMNTKGKVKSNIVDINIKEIKSAQLKEKIKEIVGVEINEKYVARQEETEMMVFKIFEKENRKEDFLKLEAHDYRNHFPLKEYYCYPELSQNTKLINYLILKGDVFNSKLRKLYQKTCKKEGRNSQKLIMVKIPEIKLKYSLINNSDPVILSKANFIHHLERIASKLNSKVNYIKSVLSLKNFASKYGINSSLLFLLLPKIESKSISDLIQISIFTSIIKRFFFFHQGVNSELKIGLYEKTHNIEIFTTTSFEFLTNKKHSAASSSDYEIAKEKISCIIHGVLFPEKYKTDNKNSFINFFYEQLSYFTGIKHLEMQMIDKFFNLNYFGTNEKYTVNSLLTNFFSVSQENPFIFLNTLQSKLNFRISPFILFSSSLSIDNVSSLTTENIIPCDPEIVSFVSEKDINGYILAKCISVNNTFNINLKDSTAAANKNSSKSSINVIPSFNGLIRNYNNNQSFNGEDSMNNYLTTLNYNVLNRVNNNNISTNPFNENEGFQSERKENECAHSRSWKDIISQVSIEGVLPSMIYKMEFGNLSKKLNKYLSNSYPLTKFEIFLDWRNNMEAIFDGIVSYNSGCENEQIICLMFHFIHYKFIEISPSKAREIFYKMMEILKRHTEYDYSLCAVINLFQGMITDEYIESEEFYSKALIFSMFNCGDMRGKNLKGNPFMMIPLFRLSKQTYALENPITNEYFKEMLKCVQYNVINTITNKDIQKGNFFDPSCKTFFKTNEENSRKDSSELNESGSQSEFFQENNYHCNFFQKWKYFLFPSSSDLKTKNQKIFYSNEYISFFLSSVASILSSSTIAVSDELLTAFSLYFTVKSESQVSKNLSNTTSSSHPNQPALTPTLTPTPTPTPFSQGSKNNFSVYLYDFLMDKMNYRKLHPLGIALSFGNNSYCETTNEDYNYLSLPRLIFKLSNIRISKIFCGDEHAIAIDTKCLGYSWGNNSDGQCGVGEEKIIKSPQLVPLGEKINFCSLGKNFTYFVSFDNNLYFSGYNNITKGRIYFPRKEDFSGELKERIISIKSGKNHHLLLTSTGKVYSWGINENNVLGTRKESNEEFPVLVNDLNNIKEISCGNNFSLALTEKGEVYGWGLSSNGELGFGFCRETQKCKTDAEAMIKCRISLPQKIPLSVPIIHAASGTNFSMFITERNEVIGCGSNSKYQLGLDESLAEETQTKSCSDFIIPTQIEAFLTMKVLKVVCGEEHCLAVIESPTGKRTVWSWGSNAYGQLGLGNQIQKSSPNQIGFLLNYEGKGEIDVECGKNFSIAFIKEPSEEYGNTRNNINRSFVEAFSHF